MRMTEPACADARHLAGLRRDVEEMLSGCAASPETPPGTKSSFSPLRVRQAML
jgi:hypothetical protein